MVDFFEVQLGNVSYAKNYKHIPDLRKAISKEYRRY